MRFIGVLLATVLLAFGLTSTGGRCRRVRALTAERSVAGCHARPALRVEHLRDGWHRWCPEVVGDRFAPARPEHLEEHRQWHHEVHRHPEPHGHLHLHVAGQEQERSDRTGPVLDHRSTLTLATSGCGCRAGDRRARRRRHRCSGSPARRPRGGSTVGRTRTHDRRRRSARTPTRRSSGPTHRR